MSLRRYFLSRRITHRSLTLSKSSESGPSESGKWAALPPELLWEIISRLEGSEDQWPQRQNVVVFGCVCKRWREAAKEAVHRASLHQPGKITFPSSLKKGGPRDSPLQCLITRNKKSCTFYLHLALTPSLTDKGKFLLAAKTHRIGARTKYIISLDAHDLSQPSQACIGKVTSNLLRTNFTIYDSQPPHTRANSSGHRVTTKQISPQIPTAGNSEIGQVSYRLDPLKSRGPRRMVCSLHCPSPVDGDDLKMEQREESSSPSPDQHTVMTNKAPWRHEGIKSWCLNFHGRVTMASVKNFQLVGTVDRSRSGGKGDGETVLLQFGKVGKDVFTMDYCHPLSAFQAFAICLTGFGTKPACP